jgi:hypothetical protein
MYLYFSGKTRLVPFFAVFTLFLAGNPIFAKTVKLSAKFNSAFGWVRPGETYPTFVRWEAGDSGAGGVTITNAVTESNETNNSSTATFTLRGGKVQ